MMIMMIMIIVMVMVMMTMMHNNLKRIAKKVVRHVSRYCLGTGLQNCKADALLVPLCLTVYVMRR
jgi:hypothetical protein